VDCKVTGQYGFRITSIGIDSATIGTIKIGETLVNHVVSGPWASTVRNKKAAVR
jgi:hypothetical protein